MALSEFDPNETLEEIRQLLNAGNKFPAYIYEEALRFRNLVVDLDVWLSAGGYPPAAWDPFSKTPEL